MNIRPNAEEFPQYYSPYVNLVPEGDILEILKKQIDETIQFFKGISETQGHFRYANNKWTIKEAVGHVIDTELIMHYRLLRIARGDTTPIPGFDENHYVQNASFNKQSMSDLLNRLKAVRESTLHLMKSLNNDDWLRKGIANEKEITARAIAYIIAGHELHHRQIIEERYIGSERYPSE